MECQIDIFGAIRHVIRQVIIDFSFSGSEDEKPVRKGDREHEQGRRGVKPTSQGRLSGGGTVCNFVTIRRVSRFSER